MSLKAVVPDTGLSDYDKARFWAKVDRNGPLPDQSNPHYVGLGPCWRWTAAHITKKRGLPFDGPGVFGLANSLFGAHRIAFVIHHGRVPEKFVCHRCDNPWCVNPEHLFEDSNRGNMQDAGRKGRTGPQKFPERYPVGEKHGMSKLNADKVREIRSLRAQGVMGSVIAAKFGITKENVYFVAQRITWRHVT